MAQNQKVDVKIPRKKPKEPSLPQRLELDGIKELSQAKTVVEGLVWTVAVILSYFAAVYLPLLTVQRYSLGTTVVSIDNQPPVGSQIVFPRMMICHTPSWNKTYLEANVDIPEEISEKASKMGLNRAEILAQFAKYINSFYVLHVEDMDDDIWTLMTELYESVIKGNVQFVDLVWDAGFRGRYIYTSCKYNKKPFRCAQAQVPITMASCHGIQTSSNRTLESFEGITKIDGETAILDLEITVPKKDLFNNIDVEKGYGVELFLSLTATPFAAPLIVPANTHAIIKFHEEEKDIITNCTNDLHYVKGFDSFTLSDYDVCICSKIMAKVNSICKCKLIAGPVRPLNHEVCTPRLMKECVHPNVVEPLFSAEVATEITGTCKNLCHQSAQVSSVTYYNLENGNNETLKTLLTIRPNLEKRTYLKEDILCSLYQIFSDVGGVIGVYTGLSCAAFLRVLVLLLAAGIKTFDRKLVKPALAKHGPRTPIGTLWALEEVLTMQHRATVIVPFEAWK